MNVTCDSDVLSNFVRRRGRGVREIEEALRTGELALNAVVLFETRGGMEQESYVRDFDRRFGHLEVLPLDQKASLRAGDLWRELRRGKKSVPVRDLLLASIADTHSRRLLTADSDFKPLRELGLDISIISAESEA